MKHHFLTLTIALTLLLHQTSYTQINKPVTDYLQIGTPMLFDNETYHLSWTSHPANNFYKQEYIQKGDVITKFKKMILVDVITGNENIKDVIAAKITEVKKMRETNPVVNYNILINKTTGEYMLDFMLSQNSPDGKSILIVERNVYRYKVFVDTTGTKGILLFGVSTRSYGKEIQEFFAGLKSNRQDLITTVSQFKIPEISIAQ